MTTTDIEYTQKKGWKENQRNWKVDAVLQVAINIMKCIYWMSLNERLQIRASRI